MGKRIDGLDEKIIASAKAEFLREGYLGASLRQIAQGAGVSTASIYARHPNKQGLFSAVVEPAASEFIERIKQGFDTPEGTEIWTESFQRDFWMEQIDFLYGHMDEFFLLLTGSCHTKYSSYKDALAVLAAQPTYGCYAQKLEQKGIAPDFVVAIYVSLFTGIFEIILHRVQKEDAREYISRLCHYFSAGWQSVLL